MDYLKRFDPMWILLLFLAGMNYAIIALFDKNLVTEIVGTGTGADVAYCMFGFAALMMVPRMLEAMHSEPFHHHTRPHGT